MDSPLIHCQLDLSWPSVFVHCKRLKPSPACLTKRAIHWFRSLSSSKDHLPHVWLDPMFTSKNYPLFPFSHVASSIGFLVIQGQVTSKVVTFQFNSSPHWKNEECTLMSLAYDRCVIWVVPISATIPKYLRLSNSLKREYIPHSYRLWKFKEMVRAVWMSKMAPCCWLLQKGQMLYPHWVKVRHVKKFEE